MISYLTHVVNTEHIRTGSGGTVENLLVRNGLKQNNRHINLLCHPSYIVKEISSLK